MTTTQLAAKFRAEYERMAKDPVFQVYAGHRGTAQGCADYVRRRMLETARWNRGTQLAADCAEWLAA